MLTSAHFFFTCSHHPQHLGRALAQAHQPIAPVTATASVSYCDGFRRSGKRIASDATTWRVDHESSQGSHSDWTGTSAPQRLIVGQRAGRSRQCRVLTASVDIDAAGRRVASHSCPTRWAQVVGASRLQPLEHRPSSEKQIGKIRRLVLNVAWRPSAHGHDAMNLHVHPCQPLLFPQMGTLAPKRHKVSGAVGHLRVSWTADRQ